jgi:hypothetical protein
MPPHASILPWLWAPQTASLSLCAVELETEKGRHAQAFLQQAKMVQLGQAGGNFVRITDLEASSDIADVMKKDRALLPMMTSSGTHIGKQRDGKVLER